jgi:parvulin-like peptidyl-prolyl isomerase
LPKKKTEKPQREVTRRQLSRWHRENRLQRFIMIGGLVVILAILVLVGTGLYVNKFKPLREVVVKAGDTEYTMDYYIDLLAYYGRSIDPQYLPFYADSIAQQIALNKVIRDEAAKPPISITISDEEINSTIKERGLSSNQTRKDAVYAELLQEKIKTEYFDKQVVPAKGEHRHFWAMLLESNSQADAIIDRINNGEKFNDIAAEISLDSTSKESKGDFGPLPRGVLPLTIISGQLLEDKIFSSDITVDNLTKIEDADVSKSIGYWLIKVTEIKDDTGESHVFAMLLPSEEKAKEIKARLDNGEDFVTLAKASSLYGNASEDGGDLGLIKKGTLGETVDNIIFPEDTSQALPLNQVSEPLQDATQVTKGGIWLVQLISSEPDKAIEGDNRTVLVNNELFKWQDQVWTNNKDNVEILLTEDQKSYAIMEAQNRYRKIKAYDEKKQHRRGLDGAGGDQWSGSQGIKR